MATATSPKKSTTTTETATANNGHKLVKPGEYAKVGQYNVANRGILPVLVSEGSKGGYRFSIDGIPVTQVMRHCGKQGWKFDNMRAVLSLLGLGEAVNDNTVACQLSSGRRSAEWKSNQSGQPHHGFAPDLPKSLTDAMETMRKATAEVAEKGRLARRSKEEVATAKTGTGKKAKTIPVAFDWRLNFATDLTHSNVDKKAMSETGVKRKGKKTK